MRLHHRRVPLPIQFALAAGLTFGSTIAVAAITSSLPSAGALLAEGASFLNLKAVAGSFGIGCSIKGNVSYSRGQRIYHVPGQYYYDDTVIDSARGERWFCSEAEARAAGWRPAGF